MSDTIRILIASDIHAGYGEGKKIIDEDSFIGLEETLSHAAQQDVDFVLLGGDLFHESIPTRYTEHKVISLLRKYCLSDREVAMQMISDPKEVFENSQFKLVNYEDPNINVGLPIFSIHGNHDDFSGKGLMALDILHDAGLVNLFGKFNSVENIVVKPVLLKKGDAKVALYGIGSQRDDRLQRAFNTGKVKFCFPPDVDEWFNILIVHQNRPPRSTTRTTGSFLHLSVLPSQMDLIIWGHEHKCEIEPQFFPKGTADQDDGFFIIQPGSTVATSVSVDETSAKHVAVLEVKGKTFKSKSIPLQGTRQIIVEDLDLAKVQPKPSLAKLKARTKDMEDEKLIHAKLKEMIENAKKSKGPKQPDLPRMRLRVIYSDEWLKIPPANCRIIGHKYDGKVANPSEIISIKTIRPDKEKDVKEKGKCLSEGREGATVHDLLRESCSNMESGLEKISVVPLRNETNQCEVNDIRGNVDKVVNKFKEVNRKGISSDLSFSSPTVKKEFAEEVSDVEDRENSFRGFADED
uniref:Mre11 DNA-binding domain-containing protein n=1 Tax=Panagrolaimus sp. PS1159 TaxID=55785 RepID=A0AC35GXZ1_9BILA